MPLPPTVCHDILTNSGKIYTCLKIDEVNNLGAARIRIRSLLAAIRVREKKHKERHIVPANYERVAFTKEMREALHNPLSPDVADSLRASGAGLQLLRLPSGGAGYSLQNLLSTWD